MAQHPLVLTTADVARFFPEDAFSAIEIRNPRIPAKREIVFFLDPLGIQPHSGAIMRMIGFSDNAFYLARKGNTETMPSDWLQWRQNQNALIVACDITESATQLIQSLLPAWVESDMLRAETKTSYKTRPQLPTGRLGRYRVSDTYASSARDALWMANVDMWPLNHISFEPDIELVVNHQESRFTGSPFHIWSDRQIFTGSECHGEPQLQLLKPAMALLSVALRRKYWREEGRYMQLSNVASYTTEPLDSQERLFSNGGNGKQLSRIVTDNGHTLFLTVEEGGVLGEDGEAWEWIDLYADEAEARSAYAKIKI